MVSPRYTPYHVPHRTEINGFMTILHGDCRFYNNIMVQQPMPRMMKLAEMGSKVMYNEWDTMNATAGLKPFDDFPTQEEWEKMFEGYCGMGSPASDRYYSFLPVWAGGNVYGNGAKPWKEKPAAIVDGIEVKLVEQEGKWILLTNLQEKLQEVKSVAMISTDTLGMAFEPEQLFENPDETPITFNEDYFGSKRDETVVPGPFAKLAPAVRVYG